VNGRPLVVLRVVLGVVLAILAIGTLLRHAGSHLGHVEIVMQAIALAETVGAVLLLAPRTTRVGAAILLAVFVAGIAFHLLHGEWNVGPLVIYAAAAQVFARRS